MSTQEFLKTQLSDAGKQINAVFANLSAEQWNERIVPEAMSPTETANHLADCYNAFLTSAAGGKHEWGSTIIEDQSPTGLTTAMANLRNKCVAIATESEDPKVHHMASEYICLHDTYHVGQMVTLRLKLGEFDPYSIY